MVYRRSPPTHLPHPLVSVRGIGWIPHIAVCVQHRASSARARIPSSIPNGIVIATSGAMAESSAHDLAPRSLAPLSSLSQTLPLSLSSRQPRTEPRPQAVGDVDPPLRRTLFSVGLSPVDSSGSDGLLTETVLYLSLSRLGDARRLDDGVSRLGAEPYTGRLHFSGSPYLHPSTLAALPLVSVDHPRTSAFWRIEGACVSSRRLAHRGAATRDVWSGGQGSVVKLSGVVRRHRR
ncbi:hypothetical protein R3P38DRAFT_3237528 [Favolaschia claudopus]|uniref:Uncharacterized protein n=1 Tax=Favolaschia claudopus TaxID=2862362 RepID=A0AAV9ZB83_9AGAR